METAIKKAIEEGYKGYSNCEIKLAIDGSIYTFGEQHLIEEKILLDPAFWQAIGKSLDIENGITEKGRVLHPDTFQMHDKVIHKGWSAIFHRFIDWIIEGKDIDSFFNELLK